MNGYFTYSVLQYKHSLTLGESLNVGILFYFPDEDKFEFVKGDGYRAKSIYPDFENSIFNSYLKTITEKVKNHVDLFNSKNDKSDFSDYVHRHILAEDASGLIFREPVRIKNVFSDSRLAVSEYSKLLLPGIITDKPSIIKHNENFILKTFAGYFFDKSKSIEDKFKKDVFLKTNHFNIKFDLTWGEKSHENYIKPLSFDLSDENSIQNKAAVIHSYLIDLKNSINTSKYRFDFIIAKPQTGLKKEYENALDLIDGVKGVPKQLVQESAWDTYRETTIGVLSNS